jgi:hypothetical protein
MAMMDINETSQDVEQYLYSQEYLYPALLIGEMGIGKTAALKAIAKRRKVKLIMLRVAQMEPGDLLGLPEKDIANKTTVWLRPEWWPDIKEPAIIFLDEMNRAPIDVRQALFQLTEEHRLHTHVLDPKIHKIVAAINPDNGKYQVEAMDPAQYGRFGLVIEMKFDVEVWSSWAYPAGISKEVIGFANAQPKLLSGDAIKPGEPSPTARGLEQVSNLIKVFGVSHKRLPIHLGKIMGSTWASGFMRYCKETYERPVSGEELAKMYSKVKDKFKKQKTEEQIASINDYLAFIGDKSDKKTVATACEIFKDIEAKPIRMVFAKKMSAGLCNGMLQTDAKIAEEITKTIEEVQSSEKEAAAAEAAAKKSQP